jgi:methionyl aminopeptidase
VIIRKSAREIEKIAAAGALVADAIAHVGTLLTPGVTTDDLDAAADAFIREHGGIPTSEGYKGYPKAICISQNEVVVHGIPGAYEVAEGDLITIDVGVTLDGYIADSAYTFGVGEISARSQALLDAAQAALAAGIAEARVGNRVGDVSHAVQSVVEAAGFSVVRSLVGHGVGRYYHEDPHIPNFGQPGRGPASRRMTIAIEPMITPEAPTSCSRRTDGRSPRRTARCPRTSSTRSRSRTTARESSRHAWGFPAACECEAVVCYDDRPRRGASVSAPPFPGRKTAMTTGVG